MPEEQAHPCNETAPREVQGELFDETTMGDPKPAPQVKENRSQKVRNETARIEKNRMPETVIKETAPIIKTDIKQTLRETTTTTPSPEPVPCDQVMPLPSSCSANEILNLIPEKHRSPMVIGLVNKALVDYPAKEVAQALAYAACNVRGGSMQFKAYLRLYGKAVIPEFEDPITRYLMSTRWRYDSWAAYVVEDDLKWWFRDFVRAYQAHAAGVGMDCLPGLPELKRFAGRIGNFGKEAPMPDINCTMNTPS